jgi:hypothetical protein
LKKAFIVLSFFFIAASTTFALEFRNTSWLMTREQVIAAETGRVVSIVDAPGQQQIVVRTVVSGFNATVTYTLENDKLLSASCSFKKDRDSAAFDAVKQDLVRKNGAPAFEKPGLMGWSLEQTEIALAHLPDGTTYTAYWEKSYFARINHLAETGGPSRD